MRKQIYTLMLLILALHEGDPRSPVFQSLAARLARDRAAGPSSLCNPGD